MRNYFVHPGIAFLLAFFSLSIEVRAQHGLRLFDAMDVRLGTGMFKEAELTDLKYIMSLDPDRLLAPFLREAALPTKAESYLNWENTGLDGHIGGHYISALSLMYAAIGDAGVLGRLNYMLDELQRCQDKKADGYIGGVPGSKEFWKSVAGGRLKVGRFDINQKWVPLYNIHKTYAGLRDAWVFAKIPKAKEMLGKLTDWMISEISGLSDDQVQNLLVSEHGGLNEVYADVSEITRDARYLLPAKRFSQKFLLDPLERQEDELNGLHTNTQIPKVIGFERVAAIRGDSNYHRAAHFFRDNVVNHRSSVIGGNSVGEHFHPANNFSGMIMSEQGPETCNTYNMLKLTKLLFEAEGLEKYIEYYERALYNSYTLDPATGHRRLRVFYPHAPGSLPGLLPGSYQLLVLRWFGHGKPREV